MTAPESVLVVGASAAGLGVVEALRRLGYRGQLTAIDGESGPRYDRPPLSKQILSGAWEPERTHLRSPHELAALDVECIFGDVAVGFDAQRRSTHTESGRELSADAVVLATGLRARTLPGHEGLVGVHYLRTLDDALALRGALPRARHAVVVGNGVLGSEIAATCARLGLDTAMVGLQTAPMADQLGGRIAKVLDEFHSLNGVRVVNDSTVDGFTSEAGRVTGAHLPSGEILPADAVVAAVGCVPATDWLTGSGLELADGIVCDAYCRAAPGVYAAGDVARWHHAGLGTTVRLENRTNATTQAAAVAANILGAENPYTPIPFFWTDQFDAKIQVFGLPTPDAEVRIVEGDEQAGRFVARYERAGRLSAVLGWNMPKQARLHSEALIGGQQ